jgi:hypothetical protein
MGQDVRQEILDKKFWARNPVSLRNRVSIAAAIYQVKK